MISDELRKEFASGILISDVISHIETDKSKYEEWLKKRKQKIPKTTKDNNNLERSKSDENIEICRDK